MIAAVPIALAAVAIVLWLLLRRVARDKGLPEGEIVYSDTDAERLERPLVSHRYQLTGKPDYIIRAKTGAFPIEVKSRRCGGGPRDRFGVLQYADRKWTVPFRERERRAILALLAEVRELEGASDVRRNHNQAARCRGCGFNAPGVCGQSLEGG
jgi:CRISPR-associated exonuclease Cas4